MVEFKLETPADEVLRERLLHASFGQGRFRKTAEKLRRGFMPAEGLAFTALDEQGQLIGTLRFWNITAGTAGDALLLGPIAIAEHRRSEGLGGMMMRRGLAEAQWLGHKAVILVGDEPYYRRFGFCADAVAGLNLPGPVERARFLGLELEAGALRGADGMITASGRLLPALPKTTAFSSSRP
jgi:predicted N-acetyltransferase YhbS